MELDLANYIFEHTGICNEPHQLAKSIENYFNSLPVGLILKAEDGYEAFYLKGELIDQGSPINEGQERLVYFSSISERYKFDCRRVITDFLTDEDEKTVSADGGFPMNLSELEGDYVDSETLECETITF